MKKQNTFTEKQYKQFLSLLLNEDPTLAYMPPSKEQVEYVFNVQDYWSMGVGGQRIHYCDKSNQFYAGKKRAKAFYEEVEIIKLIINKAKEKYNLEDPDNYGIQTILSLIKNYHLYTNAVKINQKTREIYYDNGYLEMIIAYKINYELLKIILNNPRNVYRVYNYTWEEGQDFDNEIIWRLTD